MPGKFCWILLNTNQHFGVRETYLLEFSSICISLNMHNHELLYLSDTQECSLIQSH